MNNSTDTRSYKEATKRTKGQFIITKKRVKRKTETDIRQAKESINRLLVVS